MGAGGRAADDADATAKFINKEQRGFNTAIDALCRNQELYRFVPFGNCIIYSVRWVVWVVGYSTNSQRDLEK